MKTANQKKSQACLHRGLGEPAYTNLVNACLLLEKAFDEPPMLVGSATNSRDYRDVDVRVVLDDQDYDRLFGRSESRICSPFYNLLVCGVSAWLRQVTGLPIDFQVQRRSWVSDSDWNKERYPLTMYEQLVPSWRSPAGQQEESKSD